MISNFASNPELFEQCLNLLDQSFLGCKQFALDGKKYGAHWDKISTPFIIEKNGRVIAHSGVWPITLMLNNKEHQSAAIHGVCVEEAERGKGYFKQLMQEVMAYVKDNFESSLLFTSKPYLYKDYPYTIMLPEYDFVLNNNISGISINMKSDLRLLNLNNHDDLQLLHDMLNNRECLSNQLSVINKNGNALLILNTMGKKIYYSKNEELIIIYEAQGKVLFLQEVIGSKLCSLENIYQLILSYEKISGFDRVVLQFRPDKFLTEEQYMPVLARPKCCLMVSEDFKFSDKYFRYPELYSC